MSRKHKDEIIRWANSPEGTKVWFKERSTNEWYDTYNPSWRDGKTIYIVDDKYAELRKAHADGKVIQANYFSKAGLINWSNTDSPDWTLPTEDYRIKPDKPEFKVGDWVRYKNGSISKLILSNIHEDFNPPVLDCELWTPQKGDVVICWNKIETKRIIRKYNEELDFIYDVIIPYIGQPFDEMC